MRHLVVTAVVWLVVGLPAVAADVFVNNDAGDDLLDGLSATTTGGRSGPVRTISEALRRAHKGDRIVVANTEMPYRESLSFSTGDQWGLPARPFVLEGNGAVLDGTAPVPAGGWEFAYGEVFRFRPPRMAYQLLYFDDRPAERVLPEPGQARRPQLEPHQWALYDRFIYFRPEAHVLPDAEPLRYTHLQTGITLYHVRHVRIENLIVQGFQLDGISAADGTIDCTLRNVRCRGNARSGINVGGASRLRVENGVVGDNGAVQVRVERYAVADLVDTQIVDNTAPAIANHGGRLTIDGKPRR